MRLDATTAEIVQFLQSQGYQVHFPLDAEIGDEQARVSLGNRHAIVTRNVSGLHAEYENTTSPDTVAKDPQAVLDALRRHITSGDVAVFDDVAIPTVGDESFLLDLPSGATFRIEVRPQAVPGNPNGPTPVHSDEVELKWHNFYKCPRCGHEWEDDWDCQCDDDCGECGNRHISPYKSEEITPADTE